MDDLNLYNICLSAPDDFKVTCTVKQLKEFERDITNFLAIMSPEDLDQTFQEFYED